MLEHVRCNPDVAPRLTSGGYEDKVDVITPTNLLFIGGHDVMMWWCDGGDDDDDDHYHDHDDCKCGAKFGLGQTCFVRMCGACHFEVQAAATDLPKHTRYDLIRLDPIRSEDTRNLQTPNGREKPFSALSAKPLHSVHQTHNDTSC